MFHTDMEEKEQIIISLHHQQNNIEFRKYKKREYTRFIENSRFYKYLQDEKEMMLSTFNNTYIPEIACNSQQGRHFNNHSQIDILDFFNHYKPSLLKQCTDFRYFSHCQPHYLFQYDSKSRSCHSYFHEKCIVIIILV